MANDRPKPQNQYSEQYLENSSYSTELDVLTRQTLGYTGAGTQYSIADSLATKITVSGDDTYIGIAAPGTSQATAKWQCKKISVSGGTTTITWADGDAGFDNVATDLTALSYS